MTDTLNLDDIEVHADETDDEFVRVRRSSWEQVRDAANRTGKTRKELDDLRKQNAVRDAGLDGLTEDQRSALAELVKEPTAESLKAKAIALGFIAAEPAAPTPTDAELAEHDKASAVANGAGAPASNQVTPEQANEWPTDRLMRLSANHPDTYEALLSGQTVSLPQGFI